MKAIHLTAYGNPAQNLKMVEVSEPKGKRGSELTIDTRKKQQAFASDETV